MRFPPLLRSRRVAGLVLSLALIVASLAVVAFETPPAPAVAVVAPAPPTAPASSGISFGLLIVGAGVALALTCSAGMAATTYGATDGEWDLAANWSNGVPTSILSAIVSSTGGIPVLPYSTSAVTKNLSGAGTIGLCGGNVNRLVIVTPTASYAQKFATVEHVERKTSSVATPRGHG